MNQAHYIDQILTKFNIQDCNPVSTPIDKNQILTHEMDPKTKEERNSMRNTPFRKAIGCIMYAQLVTRLDLAYAVSVVSRFNNDSGTKDLAHWQAVKRILRYLKGTKDIKLQFLKEENQAIIGYSDVDWTGDPKDRKSTISIFSRYMEVPFLGTIKSNPR